MSFSTVRSRSLRAGAAGVILCLSLAVVWAQIPIRIITLEEAEKLALLNDSKLLSAEQDERIAEERVKQAKYLFLPELGMRGAATSYSSQYPFATSAESGSLLLFPRGSAYGNSDALFAGMGYLHMSLYEGGRTLNTLKLAEAALKQAKTRLESSRRDIVLAVRRGFYRLLALEEKAGAARDALQEAETIDKRASMGPADEIDAEGTIERLREKTEDAAHQERLERLSFLKVLNLELDTPFELKGRLQENPAPPEIGKALLWALESRPELQAESYKAQMDVISVNLAQARRSPTVFLDGDYGVVNQSNQIQAITQTNWDATLGVKIPIAYDYLSQLSQKRAEQRQGELKRSELEDQVRLEVRNTHESFSYWQKEVPLIHARYEKIAAALRALAPKLGALRRLKAVESLLDLKFSLLDALAAATTARAELARAVGREIQ